MDVHPVDERHRSWEDDHPRFRVYIQQLPQPGYGSATATYDIEGADVLEAIEWAKSHAGDGETYAVALLCHKRTEWGAPITSSLPGMIWLLGRDVNDIDAPSYQVTTHGPKPEPS